MLTHCPSPSSFPPPRDPKGLRGVGDTQDTAGAGSWSNPTGKDTVSSRALAITRFSIICRCRDSVCGAAGALGTSTHTPRPPVGSRGPPGTLSLPGCGSGQLPAPPQAPTCQGCLLHGLAWVKPRHPRLVGRLQLLVLQGGLLQWGQLPVGTASAPATRHRTSARTSSCPLAWGHRQSSCPKPLVSEPPMSYPLCLSLPALYPSPQQPPMPHHSLSQPHVPLSMTQPLVPAPCPSPPYFRALCASAICSFWKISGGRNGESFPPSSEQTRRCLGRGAGPPPRSCAAGFTWAFPAEGARQVGRASPPAWPWGGTQLLKTGPPPHTHPALLRWI